MANNLIIVYQLYKNKLFDKLRSVLKELEDYNKFAETIYKESISGSWYTGKRVRSNAIYFTNGGSSFLRAYVTPISQALELARNTKDFEWLKIFNEYNKSLSEKIPDLGLLFLKDEEIKLMELSLQTNVFKFLKKKPTHILWLCAIWPLVII